MLNISSSKWAVFLLTRKGVLWLAGCRVPAAASDSSGIDAEGQKLVGVKVVEGAQVWQAQEQFGKKRAVVRAAMGY